MGSHNVPENKALASALSSSAFAAEAAFTVSSDMFTISFVSGNV
jgi:hypothetical protein